MDSACLKLRSREVKQLKRDAHRGTGDQSRYDRYDVYEGGQVYQEFLKQEMRLLVTAYNDEYNLHSSDGDMLKIDNTISFANRLARCAVW